MRLIFLWAVPLAAALPFLPSLAGGFLAWDDVSNFVDNPRYRGLGPDQLAWMWTSFYSAHFTPMTWMSFGVDYVLWGMNPFGYRLTNLLMHSANALLFFLVAETVLGLRRPEGGRPTAAAAFAALFFAVHPLRTESVAWITERRDVLSGFFFLLTIRAYLSYRWSSDGRFLLASVVFHAFSLLSKSIAVGTPIVLLALDLQPLGRLSNGAERGRALKEKTPFCLLSAAAVFLGLAAGRHGGVDFSLAEADPLARVSVAAYNLVFYPLKTFLPAGLSPFYEYPALLVPWKYPFWPCIIAVAGVAAWALVRARAKPEGVSLLSSYAAMLGPVLGLTHLGRPIVADRNSYLSCLGWALLAGAGFGKIFSGKGARVWALTAGLLLAGLGGLTWRQSGLWADSGRLWTAAAKSSPESYLVQYNLGNWFLQQGRPREAAEHFRKALLVKGGSAEAHNNLGFSCFQTGDFWRAELHLRAAARLSPGAAQPWYNLGNLYAARGRRQEAEDAYRRALERRPDMEKAKEKLDALKGS